MSNRSGFTCLTGLPGWCRADDGGLRGLSVRGVVVGSLGGLIPAVGAVVGVGILRAVWC